MIILKETLADFRAELINEVGVDEHIIAYLETLVDFKIAEAMGNLDLNTPIREAVEQQAWRDRS